MAKDNNKNKHYISALESRKIAKENSRAIRQLTKKRKAYKKEDYVTEMRNPDNVVEFDNLHTYFFTDNGTVKAVNGVSFDIPQGSTVGVVGESGCGKSVTSLSLMQLVQGPSGQIVDGSIRFRTTERTQDGVEPVMEQLCDKDGRPILDRDGNAISVQAYSKRGPIKKQFKLEDAYEEVDDSIGTAFDGKLVKTDDGEPVKRRQKCFKGFKLYRIRIEKDFVEVKDHFDRPIVDAEGKPLVRCARILQGKPMYRTRICRERIQLKDADGNPRIGADGKPVTVVKRAFTGGLKYEGKGDEKTPVMEVVLDKTNSPVRDADGNFVYVQATRFRGIPKLMKSRTPVLVGVKDDCGEIVVNDKRQIYFEHARPFKGIIKLKIAKYPISQQALDDEGNAILGADGKPLTEQKYLFKGLPKRKLVAHPVYESAKSPSGEEYLDEDGKPYMIPVYSRKGKPKFRKKYIEQEKVYDIAKMPVEAMSTIRGREIAMIFQEPMTSLNPVFTIGYQLDEVTLLHVGGADKEDAKKKSIEMLKLVGIAMPEHVYKSYPHQLSGGMRQRVMIAMALCCNPKLIIADEPTTALDVTIQAQILDLLREVKDKINGSIMLITHDLGVIAEMVDYVVVMYAGRIVEKGTVREIFKNPLHPYTIGLQKSKPVVGQEVDRLYSIPGNVPNPINMPSTCYFRDRCNMRCAKCNGDYPEMVQVSPTHFVACHRYMDLDKEHDNGQ